MAAAEQKAQGGDVSKTALLRGVVKDVASLRADLTTSLQTIDYISTWVKSTVKPSMQQIQGMVLTEAQKLECDCLF